MIAKRERPIIVAPMEDGLRGFTLRYAHEVRNPAAYFAEIPKLTLPEEMVEVAERLIAMKAGSFDPALLEDRYRTVMVEKLRKKQTEVASVEGSRAAARSQNVIDLMAALKRSISSEKPSVRPSVSPRRRVAAAAAKAPPAKRLRPKSGR